MFRRILTGLVGAATLTLALATTSLADTLPNGNETSASGSFTQTIKGVEHSWFVLASRDTVPGTTYLRASSFAVVDTTCHGGDMDGQPGARFIAFNGQTTVPILIPRNLGFAIAGARVRGTETTYDLCTGEETQVNRSHTIALTLYATAKAVTSSGTKCFDSEQVLISTFTSRTASGLAYIGGKPYTVADGGIGHQVWSYELDPGCADV